MGQWLTDEKNQVLTTIMWLDMKWTDYHFHWTPEEYGNIRQLNVPPERMWKPDLILYNSASEKFDQIFPTKVIVRSDSHIQWVPPGLFHSTCTIKVLYFPFDSQSCSLKFGTWTYQGDKVDLKLQCDNETDVEQECNLRGDVDLSTYLAHTEWALESATVKRHAVSYWEDQKYIDLTISVHIQRRALWYMFNILIPCMVLSVMSLLVFTLPPDANEKISLGVTTILALTMLLQVVGNRLPQTSAGNPVLVLYFTCTIVLCSLSLVCAIVLLNCHHHTGGGVKVPWLIRTFVNAWLASILHVQKNPNDVKPERTGHRTRLDDSFSPRKNSMKYQPSFSQQFGDRPQYLASANSPSWSNIIDLDSEFRPTGLISCERKEIEETATGHGVRHIQLKSDPMIKKSSGHIRWPKRSPKNFQRTNAVQGVEILDEEIRYSCAAESNRSASSQRLSSRPPLEDVPETNVVQRHVQPVWRDSSSHSSSNFTHPQPREVAYGPQPYSGPSVFPAQIQPVNHIRNLSTASVCYKPTDRVLRDFMEKALIIRKMKEITTEMCYITGRMHHEDEEAHTLGEWRLACRVLDRLCLLIFTALNLFISLGILTSAPTIIKAFTFTGAPSQPM
ncbi:unnamed protein product [Calicophoron daubneyi]|uniref:Neuronal acetylcholine receptor subunit alpha-7 n=1 Tax=Calicophoron daubneyi TaxID=300641 RepID=A0AAV2SW47_CALDB